MKAHTAKALLTCLAIGLSLPALADRHDGGHDRRDGYEHEDRHHHHRHHDHHDHDRYERERPYDQGYRQDCRIEGGYDRDGYYHERRVCPEPAAVISIPVPLPPVIPLPPGVRFR